MRITNKDFENFCANILLLLHQGNYIEVENYVANAKSDIENNNNINDTKKFIFNASVNTSDSKIAQKFRDIYFQLKNENISCETAMQQYFAVRQEQITLK